MPDTAMADEFAADRLFDSSMRDEESLFARGDDDALMRYEKPTESKFQQKVKVVIDGELVEVYKAKKARDAQGNVRRDASGSPILRDTTIYDAAMALVEQGRMSREELDRRIPVLCHQQHLDPVAVCRMCSVHVSKIKRAKFTPDRKLVPACQHLVEDKMAVLTQGFAVPPGDQSPQATTLSEQSIQKHCDVIAQSFELPKDEAPRVDSLKRLITTIRDSTAFLAELLVADHRHPNPERDGRFHNELDRVADALHVNTVTRCSSQKSGSAGRNFATGPKFRPVITEKKSKVPVEKLPSYISVVTEDSKVPDKESFRYSSRSIQVNHDRCIQCDRCARSCSDVKPFKVIGHTGKGYGTRISFDLDSVMDKSNCVQCGECMSACPTGALTLNQRVIPQKFRDEQGIKSDDDPLLIKYRVPENPLPDEYLTAQQMKDLTIRYVIDGKAGSFQPFRDIPYAYLRWNEGAVRLRNLTGDENEPPICVEGEFGSSAFLLVAGEFAGRQRIVRPLADRKPRGLLSKAFSGPKDDFFEFTMKAESDLILGEIACMSNAKRTATVKAKGPAVIVEMTRNMLMMMQRSRSAREVLDDIYTGRAMRASLSVSEPFSTLPSAERQQVIGALKAKSQVWRIEPGQTIISENDIVGPDPTDSKSTFRGDFYVIMRGFVKVTQKIDGQERVLAQLGEGKPFGEIALLYDHPLVLAARNQFNVDPRRRTATVTAISDVEVVRVPGPAFREFFMPRVSADDGFARVSKLLAEKAVVHLREQQQSPPSLEDDRRAEYLRQGLYQGQKMLVLDLTCCTRCDECTKACADAHGDGHSRLIREGLRFGDFLVAGSCRSCHQPYCMEGCPVDAIHRDRGSLEILVENHCIGCSLCERSCPYGSIQMAPEEKGMRWADYPENANNPVPRLLPGIARKAVNCDLCHDLVGPGRDPFCVSACPHKAAFRWSGEELLAEVTRRGG